MSDKPHFKEYAGVMTAFLVVLAYVGIGFVQTAVTVTTGTSVSLPGDWMAAMLSLSSAALGYLIGKQPSDTAPHTAPPTVAGTVAPAGAQNAPQARPVPEIPPDRTVPLA